MMAARSRTTFITTLNSMGFPEYCTFLTVGVQVRKDGSQTIEVHDE
jgi:hypothetical protein